MESLYRIGDTVYFRGDGASGTVTNVRYDDHDGAILTITMDNPKYCPNGYMYARDYEVTYTNWKEEL